MQVSTYRTQSEELAERLSGSQDRLLELQGTLENRDESVRELVQKLAEHDSEQRNAKQEAQLQTEELTEQIKMLQEQLLEVCISCLMHLCTSLPNFIFKLSRSEQGHSAARLCEHYFYAIVDFLLKYFPLSLFCYTHCIHQILQENPPAHRNSCIKTSTE